MPNMQAYLFKRKNSENWYYRFQYPLDVQSGKKKQRKISLGTSDLLLARIKAADLLKYDLKMLHLKRHLNASPYEKDFVQVLLHEPGTTVEHPDGSYTYGDEHMVTTFGPDRKRIKSEPNVLVLGHRRPFSLQTMAPKRAALFREVSDISPDKGRPLPKDIDDEIVERWIAEGRNSGITGEARRALGYFKIVAPTKTFITATRVDGKALNSYLFNEKKFKSATVGKHLSWLNGAVNLALDDGIYPGLKANPFYNVFTAKDDAVDRKIFTDDDMRLIANDLPNWKPQEQLLWILMASTGMRLGEPFQITEEETLSGCRCVLMGSKNKRSKRRLVIPKCTEQYLPNVIRGPLFEKSKAYLGKRIHLRIRRLGITDPEKVIHSLRHRAETLLGQMKVQQSVIDTILGHTPDDLDGNLGRKRSRGGSIQSLYFHGHTPPTVAEAVNLLYVGF